MFINVFLHFIFLPNAKKIVPVIIYSFSWKGVIYIHGMRKKINFAESK